MVETAIDTSCYSEISNRVNENWLVSSDEIFNPTILQTPTSSPALLRSPSPLRCVENIKIDYDENVKIECDAPEYLPYDFFNN